MSETAEKPEDLYQPATQKRDLATPGVLMITGDKVEDLEFFYPYYRLIEAGYRVTVATPDGGAFKAKHGLELKSSVPIKDAMPENFVMLYLPGGAAPEKLKENEDVLATVRFFVKNEMPIAAICHGPQILAAADVIRGKRIAAWPEIKDEVEAAGAIYENAEIMCDGLFITARWPADLPAHLRHVLSTLDAVSAVRHRAA